MLLTGDDVGDSDGDCWSSHDQYRETFELSLVCLNHADLPLSHTHNTVVHFYVLIVTKTFVLLSSQLIVCSCH